MKGEMKEMKIFDHLLSSNQPVLAVTTMTGLLQREDQSKLCLTALSTLHDWQHVSKLMLVIYSSGFVRQREDPSRLPHSWFFYFAEQYHQGSVHGYAYT
jgi:hypothetical protein